MMEFPVQKESLWQELQVVDSFIQKMQSVGLIPNRNDSLVWEVSKKGSFTVSPFYKILTVIQPVQVQKSP